MIQVLLQITKEGKRIVCIDIEKALGIILVIIGHTVDGIPRGLIFCSICHFFLHDEDNDLLFVNRQ